MDETLRYYAKEHQTFFEETVVADTSILRERFLKCIPDGGTILDFGCGSGRDSKAFSEAGYLVTAIDGSEEMCQEASKYTGLNVKCLDFFDLDETEAYDGIWACASVLHVEKIKIPELLRKLYRALKVGGVLYLSFKYGDHDDFRDGRHFTDLDEDEFRKLLSEGCCDGIGPDGFVIIDEWRSDDVRREKVVHWLNEIVKKEC